jgi:hypothetical protein
MEVRFTPEQIRYLLKSSFLDEGGRLALMQANHVEKDYIAEMSSEEAETLRDACGEQLQRAGFDEEYKTTKEGEMLEQLIDTFLIR